MDVDRSGYTDIILISASTFTDKDGEGRVYVCSLTHGVSAFNILSSNVVYTFDLWFENSHNSHSCFLHSHQRADCLSDRQLVLKGVAGERGRFGSSLAPLPDLNSDGFNDLAVGAPLENNGQGSIYIFHGDGRKTINPMYSQVCES